jgi:ammonia channel protein AmtB
MVCCCACAWLKHRLQQDGSLDVLGVNLICGNLIGGVWGAARR